MTAGAGQLVHPVHPGLGRRDSRHPPLRPLAVRPAAPPHPRHRPRLGGMDPLRCPHPPGIVHGAARGW